MCRVLNMSDFEYSRIVNISSLLNLVLTCLPCLRAWRAYVFACLRAWVLTCLCAYVLGVLVCLRACLLWWNVLFSYVIAYLVCFLSYLFYISKLEFKNCVLGKNAFYIIIRKNAFYIIRKIKVRNVTGDVVMWFLQKVVFVWRLQVR